MTRKHKEIVGIIVGGGPAPGINGVISSAAIEAINEGKAVVGVRPHAADAVLAAIRAHPLGRDAARIGHCISQHAGAVILDTGLGRRILAEPEGEPLPRIC